LPASYFVSGIPASFLCNSYFVNVKKVVFSSGITMLYNMVQWLYLRVGIRKICRLLYMKFALLLLFFSFSQYLFAQTNTLPVWNKIYDNLSKGDWILTGETGKANVYRSADNKDIILYNGWVKRSFRIAPNLACTDYKNMSNGQQLLRAVKAEARISINGKEYNVGGLYGQKENAYLRSEWVDSFTRNDNDFQFVSFTVDTLQLHLKWKPTTWLANSKHPTGKTIRFLYQSALPQLAGLDVYVIYELYYGLPLIEKSVSIFNRSNKAFTAGRIVNEILGVVEEESAVVDEVTHMKKQHGLYIETNYAFNNSMRYEISDQTTHWKVDSSYTSQVNYNYQTPCLLEVYPEKVANIELPGGGEYHSVRTYELLQDSYDRERRGLAIRKMYRTIAPWTTQNPVFMHLVSKNDEEVRTAIDQCAHTGYEALILSFGSHCNMEDTSAVNIQKWKKLADYAHQKSIQIGSYSLFSSRRISDEDDVVSPITGKPGGAFFGNAPCFGSKWGLAYLQNLKLFMSQTGFDIFENDGPYPGDVCASTTHPGHKGLEDSQWRQMELQKSLYHWCNEQGIYVNAPDWYFLDGTHKIAIGYREVNFSLPREQQMILNRQNIYDGTWEKTPSMGWGFVPLTKYQGGGAEAVLEPLSEHLKDYEQLMVQYYGAGVQACYRGPRLYDTDATRQLVTKTINWHKKYRNILNADIIHLRRADGRDWDGILHVDNRLTEKGFMLLYNPLKESITRNIKVPLYYTGLTATATVTRANGRSTTYKLNRFFEIEITVTLLPESYQYFVIH
jgi:hypothetical protein